jgi:6-phosphogluconolactonase/glucosamine-6-phosphate isomerase/deaminase
MAIHLHSPDESGFIVHVDNNFTGIVDAGGIRKNFVIPTDRTTTIAFERLAKKPELKRSFNFQQLDEYVRTRYFGNILAERILNELDIDLRSQFNSSATDFEAECARMQARLETREGKINAAILGVGQIDGHIGMHFPNVPFETGVHLGQVPPWMKKHNKTYAENSGIILPDQGYTLGVANFDDVDFLTVVAGPRPARMMREGFDGPITPKVPISFVRKHAERLGDRLVIITWGSEYDGWKPNLTL